jgi:large subunit ribosomal protein L13
MIGRARGAYGVVVQFGLERRPVTSEVAGSSPVHPAMFPEAKTPPDEGFSASLRGCEKRTICMTSTYMATREEGLSARRWYLIDAQGKVLGRLASQVANILRGKHTPRFTPHQDTGDFVVVINVAGLRLTGGKAETKVYHRHSGYPGGIRTRTAGRELREHPERMLRQAVEGMLPKNRLGRRLATKLKVYVGPDHPHIAQQPVSL